MEALGVEEITADEISSKLGQNVMPCYNVSSTDTTTWTSRRFVVVYAGKQYELQIIEGFPSDKKSPLRRDDDDVQYEAAGLVAGAADAIKVIGVSALGSAPKIGTALSVGITVYDALKAVISNLTTDTVIEDITGSAFVSLIGHMKYIFVKPYGSADVGNQVLCYVGNMTDCIITTTTSIDNLVNGVSTPTHKTETTIHDSIISKYYNDYNLAAKNYYDYKTNGNDHFIYDYQLLTIELTIFEQIVYFNALSEYPNISY